MGGTHGVLGTICIMNSGYKASHRTVAGDWAREAQSSKRRAPCDSL